MNVEPDQPTPPPAPSVCLESNLACAQQRIQQLEEALCDCEQELAAANEIVEEQDWKIEELKVQLEGADMMLEDAAEARRKLERRLDQAEDANADELIGPCPVIIPVPQDQSVPPQQPDYPPSYKPNPVVEAMIAQFRPREKK